MHMQIVIEFGSDALDGETVKYVARQAIDAVGVAIGHDVPAGDLNIESPHTVYPVNVRFAKSLRGPGQETVFERLAGRPKEPDPAPTDDFTAGGK
jgi:hypothetical protein